MDMSQARFMVAASTARVASEGLSLALLLLVVARTGSAAQAGLLVAATRFPQLVLGPALAPGVDRTTDPWARLAGAAVVSALATAGLVVTTGRTPILVPLALAVLVSATEPLLTGALSASATRTLTPPPHPVDVPTGGQTDPTATAGRDAASGPEAAATARIQAWDSLAYNVGGLAAPALVTALATTAGATAAMLALAASSGVAAVALWTVRSVASPGAVAPTGGAPRSGRRHVARALRALTTEPALRSTTVSTTLASAVLGALPFAAVAAALAHGRPLAAGGQLVTALSIGAVVGSAAMTRTGETRRPARLVTLSLIGMGGLLALAGLLPWPLALGAAGVGGLLDAPLLVGTFGARTGHAPPDVHSTVFTVAAAGKLGATSLGALAGGWLLDGSATALGLCAIGIGLLVAVGAGQLAAAGRRRPVARSSPRP